MPKDELDIVNTAIIRASEAAFKATNTVSRLIPNRIGEAEDAPRLTEADIRRLMER